MEERKHLRYKIRADRPEEEIQEMKEQIKVLTEKSECSERRQHFVMELPHVPR